MPLYNPPVSGGGGLSGLTTGQYVKASSATEVETDGVKRYVALLTQTGTDAPVATVLENTVGEIVWTRDDEGAYTATATLAGAFPVNKTAPMVSMNSSAGFAGIIRLDNDLVAISTGADNILAGNVVTILVYP